MAEIEGIERVLVVVAHPDDCDFGNAGTTAKWTDAGVTVTYCIITDGDAGGSDRSITRAEMARIRRIEQTAAAAEVGVSDLTFLGYPDGRRDLRGRRRRLRRGRRGGRGGRRGRGDDGQSGNQ